VRGRDAEVIFMPGRTLDELEGVRWGAPEFDSHLVTTCHRLRTKSVDEFTVEDLRIMIGQNIGLAHLLPRAVDMLEADPLAKGDFYPGDLLCAVLRADRSALQRDPELFRRIIRITGVAETLLTTGVGPEPGSVEAKLLLEFAQFKADTGRESRARQ
jgi:hypothetical protein